MAIKKVFVPIIDLLTANADNLPEGLLDEIKTMCSAQRNRSGSNFIKDSKGKVVAICCSYFERWMPLVGKKAVEFGAKAGSPTGLSGMSKEGSKHWSKQNRERKNSTLAMVTDLKSGKLEVADIAKRESEIEKAFKKVEDTDLGFKTREEVEKYLTKNSVKLS